MAAASATVAPNKFKHSRQNSEFVQLSTDDCFQPLIPGNNSALASNLHSGPKMSFISLRRRGCLEYAALFITVQILLSTGVVYVVQRSAPTQAPAPSASGVMASALIGGGAGGSDQRLLLSVSEYNTGGGVAISGESGARVGPGPISVGEDRAAPISNGDDFDRIATATGDLAGSGADDLGPRAPGGPPEGDALGAAAEALEVAVDITPVPTEAEAADPASGADDADSSDEDEMTSTLDQGDELEFSPMAATMDKYRLFKTRMFGVTGTDWDSLSASRRVCLGAQSSVDRLHWLFETVPNWSGPISIALFVPDVEYPVAVSLIRFLRRCNPRIRAQISFHMTYPVQHPAVTYDPAKYQFDLDSAACEDVADVKAETKAMLDKVRTKEMMKWRESFEYPQNLLRNTAKHGCQTNYTFIPDIDMIPIPDLDLSLDRFLEKQESQPDPDCAKASGKCAFVVPTYEISTDLSSLPTNKTQLVDLVKASKARKFHEKVYTINQKSSDLKRWEGIPMDHAGKKEAAAVTTTGEEKKGADLAKAYRVEHYIFKYEPLYVARADTPLFDERFIGFGMTRNTQVYEMYVSGYQFIMLDNAFTNHWGFQTVKTRPAWRAHQQEKNNAKFDDFAKELTARYGRDPYKMMSKLKSLNLKHAKVAYGPAAMVYHP